MDNWLSTPPVLNKIEVPSFVISPKIELANGIEVYDLRADQTDTLKIEWVYKAGRTYEAAPLVARASLLMMREGTVNHTSKELSNKLEFYGATLRIDEGFDMSMITLYCMPKHAEKLLPILYDILQNPSFNEAEFNQWCQHKKQQLLLDLERIDTLAYRYLTEFLFDKNHPYGYNTFPETYTNLKREQLIEHYEKHIKHCKPTIFITGNSSPKLIEQLDNLWGKHDKLLDDPEIRPLGELPSLMQTAYHEDKPNSSQSAIRLGRRLFDRRHPDLYPLHVLNNLLGGFFGSRLMTQLREKKGYTYGIYSGLDVMMHGGYMFISTEVATELRQKALDEIYKQMELLGKRSITKTELEMTQNYMLGQMLRSLDGPFQQSTLVTEAVLFKLEPDEFSKFVDIIQNITPADIKQLAQKYLQPQDWVQVTVG